MAELAEKSKETADVLLKIISKNFMSMSAMARDLNVASQNAKQLVEIMGGKPSSKEDKVAGSGLTEDERERKLQASIEKETKVTPVPKEEKKPSLAAKAFEKLKATKVGKKATNKFAELKKAFSPAKIFKSLSKYLAIGALVTIIFVSFKDSFVEWASDLWETIKESFDEFVTKIKDWFKESVQPILEKIGGFIDEWIIQPIKSFFGGFVNFIKGYFEFMFNLVTNPLETIKEVWEKFKSLVDSAIQKIADFYNSMNDKNPVKILANKLMPEAVKKALEERGKKAAGEVGDEAEKKKLERQQAEVLETQRVKKLEEEKQYKGDDEIVRARLGLPPKTETMRREAAAPPPAAPPAPTPTPTPAPAPAPAKPAPTPTPAVPAAPAPKAPAIEAAPPAAPKDAPGQIVTELNNAGITSKKAQANILANVAKESNFVPINESLDKWSAGTLFKLYGPPGASYTDSKGKPAQVPEHKNKVRFPTWESAVELAKKGAEAIGDVVYGGRMGNKDAGDGYKYRGRGYIQLTGKEAYEKIGKILGVNLVSDPDKVNDPSIAAKIVPAFFLKFKGKRPEDLEDINSVNKAVGAADPKSLEARVKLAGNFESSLASGQSIQSSSTEVASGQRSQQKPQTPVIVNAPTTNTSVIKKTEVAGKSEPSTGASTLVARAA